MACARQCLLAVARCGEAESGVPCVRPIKAQCLGRPLLMLMVFIHIKRGTDALPKALKPLSLLIGMGADVLVHSARCMASALTLESSS